MWLCSLHAASRRKIEKSAKPNILYIISDDHALQAIGAYGHPITKLAPTPNIDRLANEGALFTRELLCQLDLWPQSGNYSYRKTLARQWFDA